MEVGGAQGPDGRAAAGHAQLSTGIGEVGFHGGLGDIQSSRDLIRLKMIGDAFETQSLPWGQSGLGGRIHVDRT